MSQPPKTPPHYSHLPQSLNISPPSPSLHNVTTSFSPSKARHQAQQTHSLNILRSWLTTLLPDPTPNRPNPLISRWETEYLSLSITKPELARDMFRALQDLMYANQSADERDRLFQEAKREELDARSRKRRSVLAQSVKDVICDGLSISARQCLDSLAETSVLLGVIPRASSTSVLGNEIGTALMRLTVDSQIMSARLAALSSLKSELQDNVEAAQKQLQTMRDERASEDTGVENMQAQTAQWSRETKQVSVKIQEYKDRIMTLERTRPSGNDRDIITIDAVIEMRDRVKLRQEAITKLEERLRVFNGLPPDLAASRQEVKRARAELDRLKARREEMFERMVER